MSTPQLIVLGVRRGPKMRAEAPTVPRTFRFSPAEIERVRIAASINYQSVSEFARDAIVSAAEDCLENLE